MRVLIGDRLSPEIENRLRERSVSVVSDPGLTGDALAEMLRTFEPDVLVVRGTRVSTAQIEAASRLALIIRAGAGTDTIDLDSASRSGIFVANCPGQNSAAVAELTMAHLLNLDRRIADNVASLRNHRWNKKEFGKARGLAGRTLAIIGCGRIGEEVIRRARAFGMNVVGWSRSLTDERAEALGIRRADTLIDAVRTADAITVHLALREDTRRIVDQRVFEAMPKGAYFINTSRGEIVDQDAMLAAIERQNIRVGLDVFAGEPTGGEGDFHSPLADETDVYGTCHIGASTTQAEEAIGREVLRIIEAYERGDAIPNCQNLANQSKADHILIARHVDRVGVLATILEALRDAGHNVQEIQNLLFSSGDTACARISIVGRPSNETIARIGGLDDVLGTSVRELASGAPHT